MVLKTTEMEDLTSQTKEFLLSTNGQLKLVDTHIHLQPKPQPQLPLQVSILLQPQLFQNLINSENHKEKLTKYGMTYFSNYVQIIILIKLNKELFHMMDLLIDAIKFQDGNRVQKMWLIIMMMLIQVLPL